eukprot:scaffold140454_cov32-Tisochrysis_lutea.AAC.5
MQHRLGKGRMTRRESSTTNDHPPIPRISSTKHQATPSVSGAPRNAISSSQGKVAGKSKPRVCRHDDQTYERMLHTCTAKYPALDGTWKRLSKTGHVSLGDLTTIQHSQQSARGRGGGIRPRLGREGSECLLSN